MKLSERGESEQRINSSRREGRGNQAGKRRRGAKARGD